jgi:hypothetical protein
MISSCIAFSSCFLVWNDSLLFIMISKHFISWINTNNNWSKAQCCSQLIWIMFFYMVNSFCLDLPIWMVGFTISIFANIMIWAFLLNWIVDAVEKWLVAIATSVSGIIIAWIDKMRAIDNLLDR